MVWVYGFRVWVVGLGVCLGMVEVSVGLIWWNRLGILVRLVSRW